MALREGGGAWKLLQDEHPSNKASQRFEEQKAKPVNYFPSIVVA
jgi:hypothetical protein